MTPGIDPDFNRLATLIRTHPAIAPIREAATTPLYLVGGAIRDALADFRVDDIDLVIEGDPVPLAAGFDPAAKVNDRLQLTTYCRGRRSTASAPRAQKN